MVSLRRFLIALFLISSIGAAQQTNAVKSPDAPAKAPANGTVTGHVYLEDTKGPCHKASVYLKPAVLLEENEPPRRDSGHGRGPVTATVDAEFDGSFSFTHVAPGSYYVLATCPGYISPSVVLSLAEGRSPNKEDEALTAEQKKARDQILESLGKVDVLAGLPASADVTLERGGAISGNISYDDGQPAAGIQVQVVRRTTDGGKDDWAVMEISSAAFFLNILITDDRGNYRISGLPPGKYAVEADLDYTDTKGFMDSSGSGSGSSNAHSSHLPIYSGNTPHRKDAHGFTLEAREERTGEDIVIPISKLHTIRGVVISAHDGHVVNSGSIVLFNAGDESIAGSANLTEDDPGFSFSFILEGDYTLKVGMAADMDYEPVPQSPGSLGPPQFNAHLVHPYGSASMALHVDRDVEGVAIAVPEPTASQAQMMKDAMRGQEQTTGP